MGPTKKQPKESTKEKLREMKKARKKIKAKMRARLIVRNLPFDSTEEKLREHFERFGEVLEVKLLRKQDGKLIGCGFVQFTLVQKAAKARFHLNGKPFLDRNITCDFAIAKEKYGKSGKAGADGKEAALVENEEKKVVEAVENLDSDGDESAASVDDKTEALEIEKSEEEDDDKLSEASDDSRATSDYSVQESVQESVVSEKPVRQASNDVAEGKTVFVKNIPFSATNEDLKERMQQFGPVYYALVCVDKFTEHSKGTAFVKFVNKKDAEKCLAAGTELTLLGNILDCHKALERNDLRKMEKEKQDMKSEPKDSRNLYLVKEGVILAGSKASQGVSAGDMAKRLQLEQYKTQMLRKLNMFVSRERLIVHNLPRSWDDKKLRALFQKYGGKGAVIREAKVMRDLKNVDGDGVGASKGYGFVAFTRHENALAALRGLNNNPNVFAATRRPVVAFSIENRSMIKAKLKQLQSSQAKNPKCKRYEGKPPRDAPTKREDLEIFSGVTAKPGSKKLRSRFNLKVQAQLHQKNLRLQKRRQKLAKKPLEERKKDFIRQPRQKINKGKREKDDFSKIVWEYKKKLIGDGGANKTRWYESA